MPRTGDASNKTPFFADARAYCDEHGITDPEEAERVRLSMAHRELLDLMASHIRASALVLSYQVPGSPEFDAELPRITKQLQEMRQMFARELGMDLPAP